MIGLKRLFLSKETNIKKNSGLLTLEAFNIWAGLTCISQRFISLHDGFIRAVALCKNTCVGGTVKVRHILYSPMSSPICENIYPYIIDLAILVRNNVYIKAFKREIK